VNEKEKKKSEIYLQILKEDPGSIVELLELERPYLYDYLLRMTGQVVRSEESLEELYRVTPPQAPHYENWMDFKALLYGTARNFNSDIWNADTTNLENSGLKNLGKKENIYKTMDEFIKRLGGEHREILLCLFKYGFELEPLAQMLRRNTEVLSGQGSEMLAYIAQGMGISQSAVKKNLFDLPLHPPATTRSHNTIALSQVMEKMEEVEERAAKAKVRKLVVFFIFVLILAAVTYHFGLVDLVQDYLTQF